jgi:enterochelin esterase-like enzyme
VAIETWARRLMSASEAIPLTAGTLTECAGRARAGVSSDPLTFRLADPEGRYAGVRLCSDLPLSDGQRSFTRDGAHWVLEIEPPPIARLEYHLEVTDADGVSETGPDPGNPLRAPGAFGEKSVLLTPRYEPPAWLDVPPVEGRTQGFSIRGRGLGAQVNGRIWTPADTTDPLPLLVAHDGPEYDKLAQLTRYSGAMIASGALPPHHVALLAPGQRDEWYSASALYSRALYVDVIPGLRAAVAVEGLPVGMGASLGALAMLVAQRRAPGTFGALFLQSGSFFMPRLDSQESGFPRYARIVRVVRRILRSPAHPDPVPVQLTCGTAEENVFNNRVMARALAEQGYEARLDEVPDMHNYTGWRDAFDPHLTRMLQRVWP